MIPAKQLELHLTSSRRLLSRAVRAKSCDFIHAAIASLALPVLIAAPPPIECSGGGRYKLQSTDLTRDQNTADRRRQACR